MGFRLFIATIFFSSLGVSFDGSNGYQVLPGSQTQELIDRAYLQIVRSAISTDFCKMQGTVINLVRDFGLTVDGAKKVVSECSVHPDRAEAASKHFPKKYFIVPNDGGEFPFTSWTTAENKTILFVNEGFTFDTLVNSLTHEFAIALDAKMNMMLTTYYNYENRNVTNAGGTRVIYIGDLSEHETKVQTAFNKSTYPPIAYTFATLRAFAIEAYAKNREWPNYMGSGKQCEAEFRSLYGLAKDHSNWLTSEANGIAGMLMSVGATRWIPEDEGATLSELLDPNFKIKTRNGKLSFCQYMTTPLLTNRTLYSFFASGPRPRIGGGWGGQQETKRDKPAKSSWGFSDDYPNDQYPQESERQIGPHDYKSNIDLNQSMRVDIDSGKAIQINIEPFFKIK